MLRFVFAALVLALDQLFKHWITLTLEVGERGSVVIPGILGLMHLENDGAMLNILSGQQWLLAGIAFVVSVALVMILLRYNEGFMGTLGLSAVLGGALGNLWDRIFNDGSVVDMFETLFINFPIFNIADIFITLGMATFLIHFIMLSFKGEGEGELKATDSGQYYDDVPSNEETDTSEDAHTVAQSQAYDEFPDIDAAIAAKAEQNFTVGEDRDAYADNDAYATPVADAYQAPVAYTDNDAYATPVADAYQTPVAYTDNGAYVTPVADAYQTPGAYTDNDVYATPVADAYQASDAYTDADPATPIYTYQEPNSSPYAPPTTETVAYTEFPTMAQQIETATAPAYVEDSSTAPVEDATTYNEFPSLELEPQDSYDPATVVTPEPEINFSLDSLASELDLDSVSGEDFDLDDLLREYGSDNFED